jgi:hypothetical protein
MDPLFIPILILIIVVFFFNDQNMVEGFKFKFKKPKKIKFKMPKKINFKKTFNKVVNDVKNSKLFKSWGNKRNATAPVLMNLKPAAYAEYMDNIMKPYDGDSFNLIESDVKEYEKALSGNRTKNFVSPAPIGKRYFYKTGEKCTDLKTGKIVDRYSFIDAREGVVNDNGTVDKSMFASAVADLNGIAIVKKTPTYAETVADKCRPITINPVDVYGKTLKAETRHVSVVDVKNFNKFQKDNSKESFATLTTDNMNAGQKAFIYSISVLGLYLLYKTLQR